MIVQNLEYTVPVSVRVWKAYGITHVVHLVAFGWPPYGVTMTGCGRPNPNLPWRNTSKFSLEKINCMGCIAAMSQSVSLE